MADIKTLLGEDYKVGMTIDEINTVLASKNFVDPATLPKSVEKSLFDRTASELAKVKKELAEKNAANLSDEEKLNSALEAAASTKKEYTTKLNRLEVEKLFVAEGLSESDYSNIIEDIVSDDGEKTVKLAKNIVTLIKNQKTATEKAVKAEMLKNMPRTPDDQGKDEPMTMEKLKKLTPRERYVFSVKYPEEYKKLYGGNT